MEMKKRMIQRTKMVKVINKMRIKKKNNKKKKELINKMNKKINLLRKNKKREENKKQKEYMLPEQNALKAQLIDSKKN